MSWFQDLAGKAENILNKIDQNAATVLQQGASKTDDNNATTSTMERAPVLFEIESEMLPPHPEMGPFKKSASSISLTHKDASPKSKALSLRPSPSLGDVQKHHPKQPALQPAAADTIGSANTTVSLDGGRSTSTPQPVTFTMESSFTSSRRSSVSSAAAAAPLDPDVVVPTVAVPHVAMSLAVEATASVHSELAALKIVLNEIKAERDEAKHEMRSLQSDLYNLQITSNVSAWEAKCTALQAAGEEHRERIEALEMSNAKYVKTISDLETKLSKSTHSEADLRSKIDWTNREAKQAILELQQYRLRAQTTLQHKDKLIEQLKSAAATDPNVDVFSDPNAPAAPDAHSLELENLQRERSDLQIENRTLCEQMTALRAHIANNDAIVKRTRDDCEAAVQQMGEQLRNSAQKRRDCETDNRTQARELVVVREEMQRVQADFASKMHAKDTELAQLRAQQLAAANHKPPSARLQSAVSSIDFADRIQSLTQSLVQKQSSLETVTADRNALRFQLERIEQEYRVAMAQQRQPGGGQRSAAGHAINVNDASDDVRARLPGFMQETPFDTHMARRVKRVYSSLDGWGVQVGVFLRRYPLIRICTIFYVVLLHLWVMVVLCTSTPT